MRDFRVGQQCLLRLRVRNAGERALRSVRVSLGSSTTTEVEAVSTRMLGPGRDEEIRVMLRPRLGGHHTLKGVVETVPLRGEGQTLGFDSVAFRVVVASAANQVFNIDARSQRVGVFENIGARDEGGLVGDADWHSVPLRPIDEVQRERVFQAPVEAPQQARIGELYTGRVVDAQPAGVMVEVLPGCVGWLPRTEIEAAIAHAVGTGDTVLVRSIGVDREGRVLLSQKQVETEAAPPALSQAKATLVVVDASGGGDVRTLAEATQRAGSQARIVVRAGTYAGPVEFRGTITLVGEPGVVITSEQGAVLRAVGDELTVQRVTLQGIAPKLRYAPDGVEVRSGKVVLEDCEIATTAGNLTPGRGVAVRGPGCRVVLERCTFRDNGAGVALDTSWAGFFGDEAAGASVRANACRFENNRTAAAVAGAGRELELTRCQIRNNDLGVHAQASARATVEACALSGNGQDTRVEGEASLMEQGNHS
jgi:predicted RNA-binding protein with RPS1 domain